MLHMYLETNCYPFSETIQNIFQNIDVY